MISELDPPAQWKSILPICTQSRITCCAHVWNRFTEPLASYISDTEENVAKHIRDDLKAWLWADSVHPVKIRKYVSLPFNLVSVIWLINHIGLLTAWRQTLYRSGANLIGDFHDTNTVSATHTQLCRPARRRATALASATHNNHQPPALGR